MIDEGVDLVAAFEGLSTTTYLCPAVVWTIGYGTTRYPNTVRVTEPDPDCTVEQAEHWLEHELASSERVVMAYCSVYLNAFQRAALASFVYNLGSGAFRASTLRKRVNSGDWDDVPTQMRRWVYAGGKKLSGLVRRREAEIALWEVGVECYSNENIKQD